MMLLLTLRISRILMKVAVISRASLNKTLVIVPTALGRFQRPTILALCHLRSSSGSINLRMGRIYRCID